MFHLVNIRHWQMIQQLDFPSKFLQRLQSIFVPQSLGLFLVDQDEIMFQHFTSFLNSVFLCGGSVDSAEVDDEGLLDTKDSI
jgi:hypothetical protein